MKQEQLALQEWGAALLGGVHALVLRQQEIADVLDRCIRSQDHQNMLTIQKELLKKAIDAKSWVPKSPYYIGQLQRIECLVAQQEDLLPTALAACDRKREHIRDEEDSKQRDAADEEDSTGDQALNVHWQRLYQAQTTLLRQVEQLAHSMGSRQQAPHAHYVHTDDDDDVLLADSDNSYDITIGDIWLSEREQKEFTALCEEIIVVQQCMQSRFGRLALPQQLELKQTKELVETVQRRFSRLAQHLREDLERACYSVSQEPVQQPVSACEPIELFLAVQHMVAQSVEALCTNPTSTTMYDFLSQDFRDQMLREAAAPDQQALCEYGQNLKGLVNNDLLLRQSELQALLNNAPDDKDNF